MPLAKPTTVPRFASLGAWTISTYYSAGERVTNDGGKIYVCDVAGTSAGAGGPTGTGANIVDGSARWDYVADSAPAWVALTAYALGDRVLNGGSVYQCIRAGTSAAAGGPTGTGTDIVDDSVLWQYIAAATAVVVEPTASQKDTGWQPAQRPPAQYFNWLLYSAYRWFLYLSDTSAVKRDLTALAETWSFTGPASASSPVIETPTDPGSNAVRTVSSSVIKATTKARRVVGNIGGAACDFYVVNGSYTAYNAGDLQFTRDTNAEAAWIWGTVAGGYFVGTIAAPGATFVLTDFVNVLAGTSTEVTARNLVASGTPVGSAGPGLVKASRFYSTGTAIDATKFNLGLPGPAPNWATGTVTGFLGNATAGQVTITDAGAGAANPGFVITWPDGTFTNQPMVIPKLLYSTDAVINCENADVAVVASTATSVSLVLRTGAVVPGVSQFTIGWVTIGV